MASTELQPGAGLRIPNPTPVDAKYMQPQVGEAPAQPYTSEAQACAAVPEPVRYDGLTVNINGEDYEWRNPNLADSGLKRKATGGGYTDEQAQDAVADLLQESATIAADYDDAGNVLTFDVKADSIGSELLSPEVRAQLAAPGGDTVASLALVGTVLRLTTEKGVFESDLSSLATSTEEPPTAGDTITAVALNASDVLRITTDRGTFDAPLATFRDLSKATGSLAQNQVTGLVAALNGKSNTNHTHPLGTSATPGFSTNNYNDLTNKPSIPAAYTDAQAQQANDARFDAVEGTVAGLATVARTGSYNDLVDKPAAPSAGVTSVNTRTGAVTLTKSDVGLANVDNTSDANKPVSTATQTALNGKANTTHTHSISDVSGLQTALDGKAASSHTHSIAQVSGLQTALDGKSDTGHNHDGRYVQTVNGIAPTNGNVDIPAGDGGGSVTPVQTPGQSTSAVMSQKATTDLATTVVSQIFAPSYKEGMDVAAGQRKSYEGGVYRYTADATNVQGTPDVDPNATLLYFYAKATQTFTQVNFQGADTNATNMAFIKGTGNGDIQFKETVLGYNRWTFFPDFTLFGEGVFTVYGRKGTVLSPMTQAQREAISNPQDGTKVYQTDGTKGYYIYQDGAWSKDGGGTTFTEQDTNTANVTLIDGRLSVDVNLADTEDIDLFADGEGVKAQFTPAVRVILPTPEQKSALTGTSGQPVGGGNRFVDSKDRRLIGDYIHALNASGVIQQFADLELASEYANNGGRIRLNTQTTLQNGAIFPANILLDGQYNQLVVRGSNAVASTGFVCYNGFWATQNSTALQINYAPTGNTVDNILNPRQVGGGITGLLRIRPGAFLIAENVSLANLVLRGTTNGVKGGTLVLRGSTTRTNVTDAGIAEIGEEYITILDQRVIGGAPTDSFDPYDVPAAKRQAVVDANSPALVETDTAYYGKEFYDEVNEAPEIIWYRCGASAQSDGSTKWKWFRTELVG